MNVLESLLKEPLIYRLGWVLLHSLWQGALAGLVFAGVRWALQRHSANARYLAGCAMLLAVAAAPVLTFAFGSAATGAPAPENIEANRAWLHPLPVAGAIGGPSLPGADTVTAALQPATDWLERMLPWLVLGWGIGVAGLSCRWLQGCWWLRRMKRVGTVDLEPAWLLKLDELRQRLNIRQPVRLLQSALVEVPLVMGWLRPVILLPASTLAGLSPAQLEAILAHELAHVRRWDYLVNACQSLIETVLFYHPVVWWISRCIREERENCCDDVVVELCGDRVDYARALFTLEELRGTPPLAFAASGGSLLLRIRRLLGSANATRPLGARELSGLVLLGLSSVLLLAGALLWFRPATYRAQAVIKVLPEFVGREGAFDTAGSLGSYDPNFLQTETHLMRSPAVLNRVVQALHLDESGGKHSGPAGKISPASAVKQLNSRLTLRPVRGTSLVQIEVTDGQAADAARRANAVAAAYQQQRQEQRRRRAQEGSQRLERSVAEIDQKILTAQKKVDDLRAELRLPEPLAIGSSTAGRDSDGLLLTAETLRRLENLRVESKAELVRQQELVEILRRAKAEDLPQAILSAGVHDTLLSALLVDASKADQKLHTLAIEYGPDHLERVQAAQVVKDLQTRIQRRAEGILIGMEAKEASMKTNLETFQKEVEKAVQSDIETAKRSQPYLAAKQDAKELQQFRKLLVEKITAERINLELAGCGSIEVVEEAVAPAAPASPNRPRAASVLGLGLLFALLGVGLTRSSSHGL